MPPEIQEILDTFLTDLRNEVGNSISDTQFNCISQCVESCLKGCLDPNPLGYGLINNQNEKEPSDMEKLIKDIQVNKK